MQQSMSQLVTLTIQMSLLLTVALAIFKLPLVGCVRALACNRNPGCVSSARSFSCCRSVVLMMLLSICLALTGMMYGLVIAAVSTSEVSGR